MASASGSHKADVVVIGGGLIGMATAYELAKKGVGPIVVLERAAGVATGSTGASSACLRLRYSHQETMHLAFHGQTAYRNWADYCQIVGPRASMNPVGVLWMLGEERAALEAERDRMRQLGAPADVLTAAEVRERFPEVSLCETAVDYEHGSEHECGEAAHFLFEHEGGYCTDPAGANQDLLDACRQRGVEVRFNSTVTDVRTQNSAIIGVSLADGTTIDAGQVVNAAGPWCNGINELAGLEHDWSLHPTRIQVMVRASAASSPVGLPMIADSAGGIYFRPDGDGSQILVGSIRMDDEQERVPKPDQFRVNLDDDRKTRMLHGLHHRLPSLEHRGLVTGLAGLYTMNEDDVHPVLGPTHIDGYFVSNGYSGHGFKLGPAVGNLLAQIMTGSVVAGDVAVDHDFLSIGRKSLAVREKSVLA